MIFQKMELAFFLLLLFRRSQIFHESQGDNEPRRRIDDKKTRRLQTRTTMAVMNIGRHSLKMHPYMLTFCARPSAKAVEILSTSPSSFLFKTTSMLPGNTKVPSFPLLSRWLKPSVQRTKPEKMMTPPLLQEFPLKQKLMPTTEILGLRAVFSSWWNFDEKALRMTGREEEGTKAYP